MRTLIDIPEKQINILSNLSKLQNLSRAELIRQAINLYIHNHYENDDHQAFGILKDSKIESISYQQKLRAEWDKE